MPDKLMMAVGYPAGTLTPGDVLRYHPDTSHCRQGTAIVDEYGRAWDTFWGEHAPNGGYCLRDKDLEDAEVLFNVGDYVEIGTHGHCSPSDEPEWLRYRPEDRQRIGSQSQHCARLYVRKGAAPDLETQISNAREKVEAAERGVQSAESRLRWAREDLAKLEASR